MKLNKKRTLFNFKFTWKFWKDREGERGYLCYAHTATLQSWICCEGSEFDAKNDWIKESLWEKDQGFKNQDEEKKGRNIDGEAERWEIFSFILEIYNLYISIFQDIYSVLLINLFGINFDFSIF